MIPISKAAHKHNQGLLTNLKDEGTKKFLHNPNKTFFEFFNIFSELESIDSDQKSKNKRNSNRLSNESRLHRESIGASAESYKTSKSWLNEVVVKRSKRVSKTYLKT